MWNFQKCTRISAKSYKNSQNVNSSDCFPQYIVENQDIGVFSTIYCA